MKWNVEILLHLKIDYAMKDKIDTKIQVYFQNMHSNKKENFILEKKKILWKNIPDINILLWEKRKGPSSWTQLTMFSQRKQKFSYGKSPHVHSSGTRSGLPFH